MSKKILSMLLVCVMCISACFMLASCGEDELPVELTPVAKADLKVGFICLHDENSTYDKNFIVAALEATEALGLTDAQVIMKYNVPESEACYEAAADLVDQGCQVVFANSFGHEQYMIQAAKDFPTVQFCHATGTKSHTTTLANFHNAFAAIYEGRYLAGVAAGLKLNAMILAGDITAAQAKIGYVGAFPYAEVVSGYTSFFLGARSVCPTATMDVRYTNSWYDEAAEKEAANALIQGGCKLISQHADSMGAPTACETAGVPNVSYNGSTIAAGPNTFIISSRINWAPYFDMMMKSVMAGIKIQDNFCGGFAEGSVELSEINTAVAAPGTAEILAEVKAELIAGTRKVFDTDTFTVNGKKVTTYLADVNDRGDFVGETEVISDGYFHESEYRSAPYFDLRIDGITELNNN